MPRDLFVFRVLLWVVLAVVPLSVSAQQLEIHYINVSWGGSVLVKGPNGTTILMEAGNTGRGTGRVVPYLQSIGITPVNGLDYTFAGHQHCDHLGGLDEVVQSGYNVNIKNFYNGSSTTSTCVSGWNTAAEVLYGYLRSEVVGFGVLEILFDEDDRASAADQLKLHPGSGVTLKEPT